MTRLFSGSILGATAIARATTARSVVGSIVASLGRVAVLGTLALGLPLTATIPAAAAGYHVDRYAYVQGVDIADHLNMRRWPAHYSRTIGAIPHHGDGFYVQRCIVRPNGSSSDWCKVHFGGRWGWVNKRFLAFY